jgi:hypothetical protein
VNGRPPQEPLLGFNHFLPLIVRFARILIAALVISEWTPSACEGFKRCEDIEEGELLCRPAQTEPAGLARRGLKNARPRKVSEDFGEVLWRNPRLSGDPCTGDRPVLFVLR